MPRVITGTSAKVSEVTAIISQRLPGSTRYSVSLIGVTGDSQGVGRGRGMILVCTEHILLEPL